MNNEKHGEFSLEDIRAIRYLILVMGGIGLFMLLITDRETPIIVIGFIAVVTLLPLGAIYLLRRVSRKRTPDTSPGCPPKPWREPTSTAAPPPAREE